VLSHHRSTEEKTMALHVIVGAGPVGSATAFELADAGHDVRVITRRGSGPEHPAVQRVAADATDATRLSELTRGAAALYNCANPPYHRWPQEWPPLAAALLTTAERTGAVLVTMSNLYGYGPVDVALTEELPLAATTVKGRVRAAMWRDAVAAHRAGRIRATEARASDFVGVGARSLVNDMVAPRVLAGKPALVPANLDVPHSVTYTGDVARTLAVLGTDERAWGRAWHVPSPPPTTLRELAERLAALAGAPRPRLRRMPGLVLRVGGLFSPVAREFVEMRYQFERPFVLDSTAATTTFGLKPTDLDDALRTMLAP
jgi:nucleoside-diphosphate-sugar epimerase